MFIIRADTALLPDGWQNNVFVHINSLGKIDKVTTSTESGKPDRYVRLLLPAPLNAHLAHGLVFMTTMKF